MPDFSRNTNNSKGSVTTAKQEQVLHELPPIRRARGYHLYDEAGKRYLDLSLAGGRALLGHRPERALLELKNLLSRGLAADLNVSKPAITRALDRLSEFELVRRKIDPLDRRSVLVQRTSKGNSFMRDLTKTVRELSASLDNPAPVAVDLREREPLRA